MRDGIDGRREHQVQAEIEYAFRRRGGSGPGFGTIVAAGANSTILHYPAGDAVLRDGEVCLVDAGGEYEWYTRRRRPGRSRSPGEFTSAQRDLYSVCLAAQKEAIAAVRPGTTLDAIHDERRAAADRGASSASGCCRGRPTTASPTRSFRKYYMHRTSHWLGMDVHDVGDYFTRTGSLRPLVPGMVVTVEPGIYVPADDETAPVGAARRRRSGSRTTSGHGGWPENLTQAIPKEIAEVEAACAR